MVQDVKLTGQYSHAQSPIPNPAIVSHFIKESDQSGLLNIFWIAILVQQTVQV